jgi:hypothetical protein
MVVTKSPLSYLHHCKYHNTNSVLRSRWQHLTVDNSVCPYMRGVESKLKHGALGLLSGDPLQNRTTWHLSINPSMHSLCGKPGPSSLKHTPPKTSCLCRAMLEADRELIHFRRLKQDCGSRGRKLTVWGLKTFFFARYWYVSFVSCRTVSTYCAQLSPKGVHIHQ